MLIGCSKKNDGGIIVPPMTEPPGVVDEMPDWSPDGNVITYTHHPQNNVELQNGFNQVWLLDLTTMTKSFLTEGFNPKWSPDGKGIALVKNNDIYTIDLGTKGITQLTNWSSCFFPTWSPDGRKIAFDTDHNDPRGANAIWIMNADGTNKKDISIHGTGEWREPSWSRNGKWILHIRYIGISYPELFLMDTTGNNAIRLTYNTFDDRDAEWSPDGNKIVWGSYGQGNDPLSGIWVMNADGTNQKQLTKGGGYPSWSPDQKQIVYYQSNPPDYNTGTLWIMNSDGTNQQQLTKP
jgi:Tol biopolymer transport system component